MKIAHGLWIGGNIGLMEKLSIKSLQNKGYEFHLYSYDALTDLPAGTILEDAASILPKNSIFVYQGVPLNGIPNGGIGSYSHWSDLFAMHVLDKHGGLWTQMDVTYLKEPNNTGDYMFIPHGNTNVGPYTIVCPANCDFSRNTKNYMVKAFTQESIRHMDWDNSMRTLGEFVRRYVPNHSNYFTTDIMDLGCASSGPFFTDLTIPDNILLIHWSNATLQERKNNPIAGSLYEKLLKQYNLI